jgi:hypothetical protein
MNDGFKIIDGIKYFPIMGNKKDGHIKTYIPYWLVVIAHKKYIDRYNQSIERLAERGGFSRFELLQLLKEALNE